MSELAGDGGGGSKLKHLLVSNSSGSRQRQHAANAGPDDDDVDGKTDVQLEGPRSRHNVTEHQSLPTNSTTGSNEKTKRAEPVKVSLVNQDGAHIAKHREQSPPAGVSHVKHHHHLNQPHEPHSIHVRSEKQQKQSGKDQSGQVVGASPHSHVSSRSHSSSHMQSKSEQQSASGQRKTISTSSPPSASIETETNPIKDVETAWSLVSAPSSTNRSNLSSDGPIASSARPQLGEKVPQPLAPLSDPATRPGLASSPGAQPFNYLLQVCLPIYACVMFGLILFLVVKYCKKVKRAFKEKRSQSSNAKGKNANKIKKLMSAPIGFISNGKVFKRPADSDLKGVKIAKSGVSNALDSPTSLNARSDQKKALDCRQLTINMEDNSGLCTEDSDEQLTDGLSAGGVPSNSKSKSTKLGMLKYSLEFDFNRSVLNVSIHEARDLPGMDLNGLSDPYVNVYMLNNKNFQTFRTKIHKRTLNPVFNETFSYQISYVELAKQTLILSVYDYDKLSRHDEIGQLTLPMDSIDLTQRQVNWSELRKMNATYEGRLGDICLSLRYVPTAGRLNVVILEARQLKKMDVAGLSDPYVKLALMSQGKRLKKKKTSIKKCTLNPHFNESFSFEIPFEQAQKVQLMITVVDYDRIGTSEPIGMIALGCEQATGETEQRHWMDMLASPRRPIARWHTLHSVDFEPRVPVLGRRISQLMSNK